MKFLLDTHLAYWLVAERRKLSVRERELLDDQRSEITVSAVSIWELRIKWNRYFQSGSRKGSADPLQLLEGAHRLGLSVESLSAEHGAATLRHPIAHGDPFDDLLLTIAQETGRILLTRDRKLRGHPLAFHAD